MSGKRRRWCVDTPVTSTYHTKEETMHHVGLDPIKVALANAIGGRRLAGAQ